MDFNIRGKKVSMDVTSVVLEYNPNIAKGSLEGLMLWHCPIDNQPLFQYSAKIVMIVPGMVPTKVPVLHQCQKCKIRYMVLTVI